MLFTVNIRNPCTGRGPTPACGQIAPSHRDRKPERIAIKVASSQSNGAPTAKILVQGLHLDVTPAIKAYAEEKVAKAVHNFEGNIKEVDVKLSLRGKGTKGQEAHHNREQTTEVTVYTLRHGVVRVEDTEGDLYAAIDLVSDKLKRKLSKLKEKAIQRNTWPGRGGTKGGAHIEDFLDAEDPSMPDLNGAEVPLPEEIIREKVLLLEQPISLQAAIDNMEQVGHDFYIFQDKFDGAMKVLYKRKTFGYGVIIPQATSE